jgi:hypothetical protein
VPGQVGIHVPDVQRRHPGALGCELRRSALVSDHSALAILVEFGVMAREPYREPGARSRFAYRLTPAGRELQAVLSALQQWGDEHLPRPEGPSMLRRVLGTDCPVHVGYLDGDGREVPLADVAVIPAGSSCPHGPTSP